MTTDDTFDRAALQHALARISMRELDALGITLTSADLDAAYAQYAEILGRAVATLTDDERRAALLAWIYR